MSVDAEQARAFPLTTRARFVAGAAAAFAGIGIVSGRARAADFRYKYGVDTAIDHPITVRMIEMWNAVRRDTKGRLDVQTFPNSSLGSDPAMISQMRSGALQFNSNAGALISSVAPLAAIESVPFAFKTSEQVFRALDGDLGAFIRNDLDAKLGVYTFPFIMENGFRQITNSTRPIKVPGDVGGMKLRTPPAKLWVDTFKELNVSTVPLSLGEVYTALQTHIVDGQENPVGLIEFQRFFEVQKFLSITNHMWGGYWLMVNAEAWKALPRDIQSVVQRHQRTAALAQRRDNAALSRSLIDKLGRQGMTLNTADASAFRARMATLYPKLKSDFGTTAWNLLEKSTGRLA